MGARRGAGDGTYEIVFDGGSLGNPGRGYGSFEIRGPGGYLVRERLSFDHRGDRVTNNQAEYLTLIEALRRALRDARDRGASAAVRIRGDSSLVINQINGAWKVRNEDLRPLHAEVLGLLDGIDRWTAEWHPRSKSVKVLGH